jgi:hypothetical protein
LIKGLALLPARLVAVREALFKTCLLNAATHNGWAALLNLCCLHLCFLH